MDSPTKSLEQKQPASLPTSAFRARWQQHQYRWLTGLFVLMAIALAFLPGYDQRKLRLPNTWSNELATANFAQGKWLLNDDEAAAARAQIRQRGGRLTQYLEIAPGQWAFRQAPGHSLEMVPFYLLGYSQLANITLAVLAVIALYPLLALLYNERMAFIGSTLLLWTPVSLTALHYYHMDTFAGGILPLIAGALLLRYEKKEGKGRLALFLLFVIGLAVGWSVVIRLTNLLLLPLFSSYLLFLIWHNQATAQTPNRRKRKHKTKRRLLKIDRMGWLHLGSFSLGCLIALSGLALYNLAVFGDVVATGYAYHSPDDPFYLWKENPVTSVPGGVSTWLEGGTVLDIGVTLIKHISLWLQPATLAWLLWPIALLGLIYLLRQRPISRSTWFLFLWLLAVYFPYAGVVFFGVTRALAVPFNQTWGFFVPARYLYPFLFPFVLIISDVLNRQSRWLAFGVTGATMLGGTMFFLYALSQ